VPDETPTPDSEREELTPAQQEEAAEAAAASEIRVGDDDVAEAEGNAPAVGAQRAEDEPAEPVEAVEAAPAATADEAESVEAEAVGTDVEAESVEAEAVGTDAVEELDDEEDAAPRVKPAIPGMDLDVDIVEEGADPLAEREAEEAAAAAAEEDRDDQPIAAVTIDLGAQARYRATGKRKTAVARVTLRPGTGAYSINGRPLDAFFPRPTLQRTIRQPLETVGYAERMDVVARMHGGGVSSQAGALRHGISRALLEAEPNLRGELKRRGFLTRDARAKERKKAGLKKARKRPQFSKR
jgi:small subunit ribosomal protein S9